MRRKKDFFVLNPFFYFSNCYTEDLYFANLTKKNRGNCGDEKLWRRVKKSLLLSFDMCIFTIRWTRHFCACKGKTCNLWWLLCMPSLYTTILFLLFFVCFYQKKTLCWHSSKTHTANKRKVMAPIFNFLLHRRLVLKKGDRKLRCPQKKRRRENITARRET